jgi:hypothetical protein
VRLLLPRRGRGRSLRGLEPASPGAKLVLAVVGLLALGTAAGCGGDEQGPKTAEPTKTPRPATRIVETGGELAVGITEPNPNFFKDGDVPEGFGRWREELLKLEPAISRLTVDWAALQGARGQPPQFEQHHTGCMRDIHPCGAWNGLRDQLRALAQRQKASPDAWQALVVPYGTPEWAAAPASGCERSGTEARNRAPRPGMEAEYGKFVGDVLELAEKEGAELRYWSPWNEPNHPYFISPQRSRCSRNAPSAAVEPYARVARALKQALDRAPGEQQVALGEMAGLTDATTRYTNVFEFARRLPKDVVCGATIWGQHLYVGGKDAVKDLLAALKSFRCDRTHEIWITETGVGGTQTGAERKAKGGDACRQIREALLHWYEDPRVTAAIQYTLREDDAYPVGLVKTDLSKPYATLEEWQAWGAARRPDPADPPPESRCGG